MIISDTLRASGEFKLELFNADGSLAESLDWQPNLILNGGMERACILPSSSLTCLTYTDTTANKASLDGTWSQTGTTLTRVSGSADLTNYTVGDTIKFADNTRALITSITSASECEVYQSQTVSTQTASIYFTNLTSVPGGSSQSTTSLTILENTEVASTGERTLTAQFDFAAELTGYTLGSFIVAISTNAFARLVPSSPVAIAIGQQLRLTYRCRRFFADSAPHALTHTATGWPLALSIASVTSDGTTWTVTTNDDHYFEAGDSVTMADILPDHDVITSITSDGTTWTVTTATDHNLSASDNVTLADCDVATYDGDYTVSAVNSSTEYEITNANNYAAATSGKSRPTTPGSWYNGTHTIATAPTATTFTITNALNTFDAISGTTASPNSDVTIGYHGNEWPTQNFAISSTTNELLRYVRYYGNDTETLPTMGDGPLNAATGNYIDNGANAESTKPDIANGFTNTQQTILQPAFAMPRFTQLVTANSNSSTRIGYLFEFTHPQAKPDGYKLTITLNTVFEQDLA